MTLLTMALVLLATVPAPETFWPTTVVGWITVVGFLAGLVSGLWAYAKFLAHLNGLGARVDDLKQRADAAEAREDAMAKVVDRLTVTSEHLLTEIGRAQRQAADCDTNTEQFAIEIGSKLSEFQRSLGDKIANLGERMAGVERELELGRTVRFNVPVRQEDRR